MIFTDINECALSTPPCPGRCINTQGGFYCQNTKNQSFSHSGAAIISVGKSLLCSELIDFLLHRKCIILTI